MYYCKHYVLSQKIRKISNYRVHELMLLHITQEWWARGAQAYSTKWGEHSEFLVLPKWSYWYGAWYAARVNFTVLPAWKFLEDPYSFTQWPVRMPIVGATKTCCFFLREMMHFVFLARMLKNTKILIEVKKSVSHVSKRLFLMGVEYF